MTEIDPKKILASVPAAYRFPSAFEAYMLFQTLPKHIRYPAKDRSTGMRPTPQQVAQAMGVNDERILFLAGLQTQKRFAEHFGVTEQTLGRWNKKLAGHDLFKHMQQWMRRLTGNVVAALYMQCLREDALPGHFKLFYEIAGWNEKLLPEKRKINTVQVNVASPL